MFVCVLICRLCAYIMHTAQEQFIAYVFHCEPSAGALSKTIEAACKVSYLHLSIFVTATEDNNNNNNWIDSFKVIFQCSKSSPSLEMFFLSQSSITGEV